MEIEDTSRAHQETEAELNRYCDSLQVSFMLLSCNQTIFYLHRYYRGVSN